MVLCMLDKIKTTIRVGFVGDRLILEKAEWRVQNNEYVVLT